MSQIGFSQARTGRRMSVGGGGVEVFRSKPGNKYRVVLPLRKGEDGEPHLVLFGETVHHLNRPSIIQIPKRGGGHYSPYTFRCTHPYSQLSSKESLKFAEREEMCVLCEFENLQNRHRMEHHMNEEFGTEEGDFKDGPKNFSELSSKEQKKFFKEYELDIEKSYYEQEGEDGETFNVQNREMYILVMELETEEVTKKKKNKNTNKLFKMVKTVIKKDDEGNVQYKPKLMKVSGKRLQDFKTAVDNAIQASTLSVDNIYTIIENEGTEFEEEVNIGWVDFQLNFPEGTLMESARNLDITAMTDEDSATVNNPELKNQIENNIDNYYKDASNTFKRVFKHLQGYTREDQLELLSDEARGEFLQLREDYRDKKDEEFEQDVYNNVKKFSGGNKKENEGNKKEEKSKPKEEKSKPKEEKSKEVKKEVPKSKKEEVENDDLDGDLEDILDEDEDFDDLFD